MTMQNEVVVRAGAVGQGEARVNVTWRGQNSDLPDTVAFDMSDENVRNVVAEAIHGGIPGIAADAGADLGNFVVDRFTSSEARPWNLLSVRPKTEFG